MKKEQNLKNSTEQVLTIPVVVRSAFRKCGNCNYKWGYSNSLNELTNVNKCPNCGSNFTMPLKNVTD